MNMEKRLSNKIPPEILQNVQFKLDEVMCLLKPYLVVLSQAEREALAKIETESIKFLEVSHEVVLGKHELFPAFLKAAIFREEFVTAHELWIIISKLCQLKDSIYDTEMLIGNGALETALAFYNTVKIAAKHDIPGAKVIYEELKPAFQSRKRKPKKAKSIKDAAQGELFDSSELFDSGI